MFDLSFPKRFVASLILVCQLSFPATVDKTEHFEMKIRPILANRCYGCHSTAPLGGLAMNSRNGLLKGGKTGPAVVPGKPEESLLIQAVEHSNDKMKMPMGQGKMPDAEIALLTAWIKDGAFWPEVPAPCPSVRPVGGLSRPVGWPPSRRFLVLPLPGS